MMRQPSKRQPPKPRDKPPSTKAQRQLAMMQLRAEAASAKAVALALLAADFGGKIADARMRYRGDELEAALNAIMRDQRAAEKALNTKLDGEAADRRRAVLEQYNAHHQAQRLAVRFRAAAEENTRRGGRTPTRPRERIRSSARVPRLRQEHRLE